MSSLLTKVDEQTLGNALQGDKPVVIWLSDGVSAPSDMVKTLQETAENNHQIMFLTSDVSDKPDIKSRFSVGKHPVLIAWHNGEVISRRSRPWATDVHGVIDKLKQLVSVPDKQTDATEMKVNEEKIVDNKPVTVTDKTFEKDVLQSELPVLVDFWAEWCGPCRMVAPVLEKLADEYAGKVRIAKVDVDANPGLSQAFQIMSIPTLMFVKEGKIVGMNAGAAPEPALRNALEQLIALEIPEEEETTEEPS